MEWIILAGVALAAGGLGFWGGRSSGLEEAAEMKRAFLAALCEWPEDKRIQEMVGKAMGEVFSSPAALNILAELAGYRNKEKR